MRQYLYILLLSLFIGTGTSFTVSCSEGGNAGIENENSRPVIRSLTPSMGAPGDKIKIIGREFLTDKSRMAVTVDGNEVEISDLTTGSITFTVPELNYEAVSAEVIVRKDRDNHSLAAVLYQDLNRRNTLAIQNAEWKVEKIRQDITWKSAKFNVFNGPRSINILEIAPIASTTIGVDFTWGSNSVKKTSSMCEDNDAVAGINASYFNSNGPIDFFRYDWTVYTTGRLAQGVDAAMIWDDSKVLLKKLSDGGVGAAELNYPNVMVCGPMLVENSMLLPQHSGDHFTVTHPRTAIGTAGGGRVFMVTVDGRFSDKIGLSTTDLSLLMKAIGATNAMNLDGGGSTTMWIKGKGVVNDPCNTGGERSVGSVIYVK